MNEIIEAIKDLRRHLSSSGDYAIVRADGEKMGIGDQLIIGDVLERIDNAIEHSAQQHVAAEAGLDVIWQHYQK